MASAKTGSPHRWPAEWEPHEATWLAWPKNGETWPGLLPAVEAAYVEMVRALLPGERVRILVDDGPAEDLARQRLEAGGLAGEPGVELFQIPTDDAWIRDYGPLFVFDEAKRERVVLAPRFNAWGGKYPPWDRDDAVARAVAARLGLRCVESDLVLEAGSIEGDGRGSVLTTESCLLNPNRGADGRARRRGDLEGSLGELLGARRVLWLGDGIEGDDTDGHVDDLTRFVSPGAIVTAVESDPADVNHLPLAENLRRLRALRDPAGHRYEIAELPMPPAIHHDGARLPASYANFYIANAAVLMPAFGAPADARAASVLGELLPGREIVPIPARELVVGLGAVHCLTQQEPAATASSNI